MFQQKDEGLPRQFFQFLQKQIPGETIPTIAEFAVINMKNAEEVKDAVEIMLKEPHLVFDQERLTFPHWYLSFPGVLTP